VENKESNRKLILKKIAALIKKNPTSVARALSRSNVFVESIDKKNLADLSAYNIVNNPLFKRNIAIVIAESELRKDEFSSFGKKVDNKEMSVESGKKIIKGAASGAEPITIIIGAIVGTIDAAFSWASSGKKAKISEEQARAELYEDLFTDEKKKGNWIPIAIVGGVLLVGGIVTYFALRK